MRRLMFLAVLLVSSGLVASACGGGGDGEPKVSPLPGNTELVVGPNRFALGLADSENNPILGDAGTSVHLRFFYGEELKSEHDATFTSAIPGAQGFFTANVDFDQAGQWTAEAVVTREGDESTVTFTFPVTEESQIPNIGDPAPPSINLTATDDPTLTTVSTDPEPEPALYEMTVSDALEAGRPFVVIFATPAFCVSRFCGPVVDTVKEVREDFADQVNFIHIEPFELDEEGALVTEPGPDGQPAPVPAEPALAWNLQTEPWIFIVGADGTIAARFELAASADELREAIQITLG